jgi:hypothetical protein
MKIQTVGEWTFEDDGNPRHYIKGRPSSSPYGWSYSLTPAERDELVYTLRLLEWLGLDKSFTAILTANPDGNAYTVQISPILSARNTQT